MKKSIIMLMLLAFQYSYSQWELLYPTAPTTTITSFAVSGNNIFAGSTKRGVYLSTDKGQSWSSKRIGLDIKPVQVNSIAISGNNVFVATADSGVYRSGNMGNSWEKIINGLLLLNVNSVAATGSNIFAGTNDGFYRSTDFGETWELAFKDSISTSILAFKLHDGNLIIGASGTNTENRVFVSTDMGESWIRRHETSVRSDAIFSNRGNIIHDFDIKGDYIYAVVSPSMIFKAKLNELLPTSVEEEKIKNEFTLFPNPTSDYIYINFNDLDGDYSPSYKSGLGSVRIYNTLGQCVSHLTPTLSKGEGVRIDVSQLPPGVYLMRVGNRAEKFVKW